ncbi:serine threonine-protein phosphatase 6 regulatory subunit [Musa troglodytarum]|uniref:Serine threonine-protein phosphatase 6 regulatory subunit n=1 Tax=Musa troglodytarum TaxID=320322 RepID=A0A9E7FQP5_9LILI|nr:serine threonine-protein phosphatase 6 regulatory subunit [Musa troglodytarum]
MFWRIPNLPASSPLMNRLFSFLEPNHKHNSTLAGYFSKTHEAVFHHLVDLIGITSIMEILIHLVGADNHTYPSYMDIMQWLADTNLLEMIVDKLSPSYPAEVNANAAEVLMAIIRNTPSALAAKLSSQSFVSRIFGHALENSPSALVHTLSVCISLLDPKRSASAVSVHYLRSQHLHAPLSHVDSETLQAMLTQLETTTSANHPHFKWFGLTHMGQIGTMLVVGGRGEVGEDVDNMARGENPREENKQGEGER